MRAVRTYFQIVGRQVGAQCRGDRLLADTQVHRALHDVGQVDVEYLLLRMPDKRQPPVKLLVCLWYTHLDRALHPEATCPVALPPA